ncbi:hypothetical protein OUZ56_022050 [Daphnia magna]|uniref:Uncharacterized protein n=1 Tax=Daphnia magna TaxID=35525 RepID=A0ABR0AV82_9CRUS|nr:hypothetical protein OUZ56_022050 [Daphnia magna]
MEKIPAFHHVQSQCYKSIVRPPICACCPYYCTVLLLTVPSFLRVSRLGCVYVSLSPILTSVSFSPALMHCSFLVDLFRLQQQQQQQQKTENSKKKNNNNNNQNKNKKKKEEKKITIKKPTDEIPHVDGKVEAEPKACFFFFTLPIHIQDVMYTYMNNSVVCA